MSDQIRYTLDKPIQFTASRKVEELTFKTSMTVREMRRLDTVQGEISTAAMLMAILSEEPLELIDALDAADFRGANQLIAPFLRDTLGIGGP